MSKSIGLKISYELEVRDKNGKLLKKVKGTSKSLLANYMRFLRQRFNYTGINQSTPTYVMKDTGGNDRTIPPAGAPYHSNSGFFGGALNVDTNGLVVGSSDEAVEAGDNALAVQILNGATSGKLVHGATSLEAVSIVGLVSSFRFTRVFTNNSGASITVREIGGYFGLQDFDGATRYFCYLRDVLASPTTIPDGATLTVRYKFSVTA